MGCTMSMTGSLVHMPTLELKERVAVVHDKLGVWKSDSVTSMIPEICNYRLMHVSGTLTAHPVSGQCKNKDTLMTHINASGLLPTMWVGFTEEQAMRLADLESRALAVPQWPESVR